MTIVGEREQYLGLLVEEYRLLGSAGIQAGQHTYTALQWGTAVVGILAGAAISQWGKHDAVVELVFLVGVPALVAVGMQQPRLGLLGARPSLSLGDGGVVGYRPLLRPSQRRIGSWLGERPGDTGRAAARDDIDLVCGRDRQWVESFAG